MSWRCGTWALAVTLALHGLAPGADTKPRKEEAISGSEHFFGKDRREIALFAWPQGKSLQIEGLPVKRKLEFGAARIS